MKSKPYLSNSKNIRGYIHNFNTENPKNIKYWEFNYIPYFKDYYI